VALVFVRQFVVLPEEAHLRSALGAPYENYLRAVRRWI
jgi:protein-S-isoprenylcysteine O-methyltransferase Ste14